jgi:hypothetical protein
MTSGELCSLHRSQAVSPPGPASHPPCSLKTTHSLGSCVVKRSAADIGVPLTRACRGQDITSTQSHKSYRPFTILVFRLTHQAWKLLTAAVPAITQLLPTLPASQLPQQDEATPERPDGEALHHDDSVLPQMPPQAGMMCGVGAGRASLQCAAPHSDDACLLSVQFDTEVLASQYGLLTTFQTVFILQGCTRSLSMSCV